MEDSPACFDYADSAATIIGFWQGYNHAQEFAIFEYYYNSCINQ